MLEAVLFDMDGVIADTEFVDYRIQCAFVRQVRAQAGLACDRLDCSPLMGQSYDALYRALDNLTEHVCSRDELRAAFDAYDAEQRQHLSYAEFFRPDLLHVLDYLDAHRIRAAVVSSSTHAHIEEVLGACGVLDRFCLLFSGERVPESKPNPRIYRDALRTLGVEPASCVAIEDSPGGIAAARGAGLRVIGYRERRIPVDQSAATWLVDDFPGALAIIRTLAEA